MKSILLTAKAIQIPPLPLPHLCVILCLTNHFLMKCLIPSTTLQSSFLKFLFCMRRLRHRDQGASQRLSKLRVFKSRLELRHSDSRFTLCILLDLISALIGLVATCLGHYILLLHAFLGLQFLTDSFCLF